jgi:hypothetical protein
MTALDSCIGESVLWKNELKCGILQLKTYSKTFREAISGRKCPVIKVLCKSGPLISTLPYITNRWRNRRSFGVVNLISLTLVEKAELTSLGAKQVVLNIS